MRQREHPELPAFAMASAFFEIADVFVRFKHIARFIANANHRIV